LTERLFARQAGTTGREGLEFRDFVVGTWDLCTLSKESLADEMFAAFDADGSGDLDMEELAALVRFCGSTTSASKRGQPCMADIGALREADVQGAAAEVAQDESDPRIEPLHFRRLVDKVPRLLQPCLDVQQAIQRASFGPRASAEAAARRYAAQPSGQRARELVESFLRDREAARDATMRAELTKAEALRKELEAQARDELRAQEVERWRKMGPAERAEAQSLLALSALRAMAVTQFHRARASGHFSEASLLEHNGWCGAVRAVETQLQRCLVLGAAAGRELQARAKAEAPAAAAEQVSRQRAEDRHAAAEGEAKAAKLAAQFRRIVMHGGTGRSVLPAEAFNSTANHRWGRWLPSGPAVLFGVRDPALSAARRVELLSAATPHLAQAEAILVMGAAREAASLRSSLLAQRAVLLADFGVDDRTLLSASWRRDFDAVKSAYFWSKLGQQIWSPAEAAEVADGEWGTVAGTRDGTPVARPVSTTNRSRAAHAPDVLGAAGSKARRTSALVAPAELVGSDLSVVAGPGVTTGHRAAATAMEVGGSAADDARAVARVFRQDPRAAAPRLK